MSETFIKEKGGLSLKVFNILNKQSTKQIIINGINGGIRDIFSKTKTIEEFNKRRFDMADEVWVAVNEIENIGSNVCMAVMHGLKTDITIPDGHNGIGNLVFSFNTAKIRSAFKSYASPRFELCTEDDDYGWYFNDLYNPTSANVNVVVDLQWKLIDEVPQCRSINIKAEQTPHYVVTLINNLEDTVSRINKGVEYALSK